MPLAPNDPASALCDIGDLAEDVGILIRRMNRVESIFNQILGINITALSMSDIAETIGNALDKDPRVAKMTSSAAITYASPTLGTQLDISTTIRNDRNVVTLIGDAITLPATGKYIVSFTVLFDYPSSAGANKIANVYFGPSSGVIFSDLSAKVEVSDGSYGISLTGILNTTTANFVLKLFATDTGAAGGTRTVEVTQVSVVFLGA